MGEYVKWNNDSFKIGTCENLYYARRDEIEKALKDCPELKDYIGPIWRYRFPWPDEDGYAMGARPENEPFKTYEVNCTLGANDELHDTVTFSTGGTYNINVFIPCPSLDNRSFNQSGLSTSHRYAKYKIMFQKYTESGDPITVVSCSYCNEMFRLTKEAAETIKEAILHMEPRESKDEPGTWYKVLASRIHGE